MTRREAIGALLSKGVYKYPSSTMGGYLPDGFVVEQYDSFDIEHCVILDKLEKLGVCEATKGALKYAL
jgi:hypothetical protein